MDYEVHVNRGPGGGVGDGPRDVKPIVLSLLPGEETIFEINIVNHGEPANVSLEASSPLIKAVRLKGADHHVQSEETVPILIRMPQNVERLDGRISVISDDERTEIPISLVQDDDSWGGGHDADDAGKDPDEDDEGDDEGDTDDLDGEEDGRRRLAGGLDDSEDEDERDEDEDGGGGFEYAPCYRSDDGGYPEGNGDGRHGRARRLRPLEAGPGRAGSQDGPAGGEVHRDDPVVGYGARRYGGRSSDDYPPADDREYSRNSPEVGGGTEDGYTEDGGTEGGSIEDSGTGSYPAEDDQYDSEYAPQSLSLAARSQVVPGIMILALIGLLVLTFYTKTLPEFPGALASSVLIVSLIIYGAATLLKA